MTSPAEGGVWLVGCGEDAVDGLVVADQPSVAVASSRVRVPAVRSSMSLSMTVGSVSLGGRVVVDNDVTVVSVGAGGGVVGHVPRAYSDRCFWLVDNQIITSQSARLVPIAAVLLPDPEASCRSRWRRCSCRQAPPHTLHGALSFVVPWELAGLVRLVGDHLAGRFKELPA